VLILRTLPSLVVVQHNHKPKKFIFSNWRKENKYLPEDGQELTETCRRIMKTFKQYNYFNVLFLIK